MNRLTGKLRPRVTWAGAALGLLVLAAAPPPVTARTYNPNYPPTPDGDPTADDQPSPTPKGGYYAAVRPGTSTAVRQPGATLIRSTVSDRLIWLSFVRTWIRIGVR